MFHLRPMTYLMLAAAIAVVAVLLAAPAFAASPSQCSSCHGSAYNTQLDILEGNSQNKLPSTIQVGQTQTVTVVIENINDASSNNDLSGVTVTLSSQNGHFAVNKPTVNIGNLPTGTAVATWQITATSAESDTLVISASATNTHNNLKFTDSYSPSPSITVNAAPTPTPVPTPVPSPTPTPTAA